MDESESEHALDMHTIYQNPSDYPGQYVVRRFRLKEGQVRASLAPSAVASTLEEARARLRDIRPDAVCIGRSPHEDPIVVESWI